MGKQKNFKTGCLVCGKELVYFDETKKVECFYCGSIFDSNVECADGHFICDRCHSISANDLIETICIKNENKNPIELATDLMKNPAIKMHGPEHHFLVPAIMLSVYYNTTKEYEQKEGKIKQARSRAEKIQGGFCGSHGTCSAAIGNGIFISLITNTTPLSKKEWKQSNLITAKTLEKIAYYGGPRCCKRNTYIALLTSVSFLKENFNIKINTGKKIKCIFNNLNKECVKEKCPFF